MKNRIFFFAVTLLVSLFILSGCNDAKKAQSLVNEGINQLDRGETEKARQSFEKALKVHPGDPSAMSMQGVLTIKKGDYMKGYELCKKALLADSKNPIVRLNMARAYLVAHKFKRAEAEALRTVELDSTSSDGYALLGKIQIEMGRQKEAEEMLSKALELCGTKPSVLVYRGDVLVKEGKIDEAEKFYEKAIGLNVQCDEAYVGMAEVALRRGNMEAALKNAKYALDINAENAQAHLIMGKAFLVGGSPEKAIEAMEKAVRCDKRLYEAYSLLGKLYIEYGDGKRAIVNLEKAVDLNPPDAESLLQPRICLFSHREDKRSAGHA